MKHQRCAREGPSWLLEGDPTRAAMSIIGLAISDGRLDDAQALLAHHLADRDGTGLAARYPLAVDELQRRIARARCAANARPPA